MFSKYGEKLPGNVEQGSDMIWLIFRESLTTVWKIGWKGQGKMKAEKPITKSLKRSRKALLVTIIKEVTIGQIWYIFGMYFLGGGNESCWWVGWWRRVRGVKDNAKVWCLNNRVNESAITKMESTS